MVLVKTGHQKHKNTLDRPTILMYNRRSLKGVHSMKNELIRSSAAEYLTFIAATGDSEQSIEMRYEDENIWLCTF